QSASAIPGRRGLSDRRSAVILSSSSFRASACAQPPARPGALQRTAGPRQSSLFLRSKARSCFKMCGMWTIHPRAERVAVLIPILYRRPGDDEWMKAKVVNLSQSGVLFGPTGLDPGAEVEVILSPPAHVTSLATG